MANYTYIPNFSSLGSMVFSINSGQTSKHTKNNCVFNIKITYLLHCKLAIILTKYSPLKIIYIYAQKICKIDTHLGGYWNFHAQYNLVSTNTVNKKFWLK